MTVYAIIAPAENPLLTQAVEREFAGSFFKFAPGQFVVTGEGMTSRDIAEKLGATGQVGNIIVFTTAGHFGWHRKDLWEWLQTRSAA